MKAKQYAEKIKEVYTGNITEPAFVNVVSETVGKIILEATDKVYALCGDDPTSEVFAQVFDGKQQKWWEVVRQSDIPDSFRELFAQSLHYVSPEAHGAWMVARINRKIDNAAKKKTKPS